MGVAPPAAIKYFSTFKIRTREWPISILLHKWARVSIRFGTYRSTREWIRTLFTNVGHPEERIIPSPWQCFPTAKLLTTNVALKYSQIELFDECCTSITVSRHSNDPKVSRSALGETCKTMVYRRRALPTCTCSMLPIPFRIVLEWRLLFGYVFLRIITTRSAALLFSCTMQIATLTNPVVHRATSTMSMISWINWKPTIPINVRSPSFSALPKVNAMLPVLRMITFKVRKTSWIVKSVLCLSKPIQRKTHCSVSAMEVHGSFKRYLKCPIGPCNVWSSIQYTMIEQDRKQPLSCNPYNVNRIQTLKTLVVLWQHQRQILPPMHTHGRWSRHWVNFRPIFKLDSWIRRKHRIRRDHRFWPMTWMLDFKHWRECRSSTCNADSMGEWDGSLFRDTTKKMQMCANQYGSTGQRNKRHINVFRQSSYWKTTRRGEIFS